MQPERSSIAWPLLVPSGTLVWVRCDVSEAVSKEREIENKPRSCHNDGQRRQENRWPAVGACDGGTGVRGVV